MSTFIDLVGCGRTLLGELLCPLVHDTDDFSAEIRLPGGPHRVMGESD